MSLIRSCSWLFTTLAELRRRGADGREVGATQAEHAGEDHHHPRAGRTAEPHLDVRGERAAGSAGQPKQHVAPVLHASII